MTMKNLANGSTNRTDAHNTPTLVASADVLIVGAGPAGASLACFLATYGKDKPLCFTSIDTSPDSVLEF